jgi:hypothetical protein
MMPENDLYRLADRVEQHRLWAAHRAECRVCQKQGGDLCPRGVVLEASTRTLTPTPVGTETPRSILLRRRLKNARGLVAQIEPCAYMVTLGRSTDRASQNQIDALAQAVQELAGAVEGLIRYHEHLEGKDAVATAPIRLEWDPDKESWADFVARIPKTPAGTEVRVTLPARRPAGEEVRGA